MISKAKTVSEYIEELPPERKKSFKELRSVIKKNIPAGFKEGMGYGMVGFNVPHSIYKEGYHCDPKIPLPFMSIASQKNFIAVYHMGIYSNPVLLKWFTDEFKKQSKSKLDMGKGCIRFKKPEEIPFKLIGELASKISVKEWISMYEKAREEQWKKKK